MRTKRCYLLTLLEHPLEGQGEGLCLVQAVRCHQSRLPQQFLHHHLRRRFRCRPTHYLQTRSLLPRHRVATHYWRHPTKQHRPHQNTHRR